MKVVEESDSYVKLTEPGRRGEGQRLERRLEAVIPLIADSIGVAAEDGNNAAPMQLFRLFLEAADPRALAVIQERADTSARAWLSGLRESLVEKGLSGRKNGRAGRRVTVSVLVRTQDSTRNTKR
jgi:hypothetical protein